MEPLVLLFILEELSRMKYEQVWKNKNRVAVRDFWVNKVTAKERQDIIRAEEVLLFVRLREIQKRECECDGCDRKRQELKNDIHLVYKEYTDDLKDFDEQNKSMVACEVMLRSEPNYLRMIVNIETKEIMDDNRDTHRREYYNQVSSAFCLFAARMLDKRIIQAYNEALISERQTKLIQEEEDEKQHVIERKQRKSEHRKDVLNKKRLLKQQEQEKLMEQQRQKEQEEAKAKQEKERRSKLKRQAKQVLRDKQKQELEQQRMKSYAKLKKRKEKDAMLKKSKSATLSPTLTCCSHESLSMMSPASLSTEITVSTITADEKLLDHRHDACMPPIGCFHLPVALTPDDTSNNSFFLSSWMDHVTALGEHESYQKQSVNKSSIWSNGWHASTSVSKDFHHDLFKDVPMEKTNETIVAEAKHVYSALDRISFAKYTRTPECYTLSYLLNMMHELLSNNAITLDRLRQALDASDAFHCQLKLPENIMTVQLADSH